MCLINTCDSTTVKRDESMTEAQNITHVSQCFSHVLHLVQPSLVDVKGAHSTVQKNSITHQQGVVITACMFGCASLRVRRVKCSLYSHVNCVLGGGGAVVTAAVSSVCLKLPWQPNTKISLP